MSSQRLTKKEKNSVNGTTINELQVPLEFIEENQKLDQTRPIPKKGGPYSKKERKDRQNEVFKLHFEYGYSSRQIAEMMKINRHTIDEDINHLYSQLSKEWRSYDLDALLMKQNKRLELQRTRLLKELEKTESLQDKLAIEKMIFEIDSRILHTSIKASTTRDSIIDLAVASINNWASDKKLDVSFIHSRDITQVNPKTRQKIDSLIKEDRKNRVGRS